MKRFKNMVHSKFMNSSVFGKLSAFNKFNTVLAYYHEKKIKSNQLKNMCFEELLGAHLFKNKIIPSSWFGSGLAPAVAATCGVKQQGEDLFFSLSLPLLLFLSTSPNPSV